MICNALATLPQDCERWQGRRKLKQVKTRLTFGSVPCQSQAGELRQPELSRELRIGIDLERYGHVGIEVRLDGSIVAKRSSHFEKCHLPVSREYPSKLSGGHSSPSTYKPAIKLRQRCLSPSHQQPVPSMCHRMTLTRVHPCGHQFHGPFAARSDKKSLLIDILQKPVQK